MIDFTCPAHPQGEKAPASVIIGARAYCMLHARILIRGTKQRQPVDDATTAAVLNFVGGRSILAREIQNAVGCDRAAIFELIERGLLEIDRLQSQHWFELVVRGRAS